MKKDFKNLVKEMIEEKVISTDKPTIVESVLSGTYYTGKEDAENGIKTINMKTTINLLNVAEDYLRAINNEKCIKLKEFIKELESELDK